MTSSLASGEKQLGDRYFEQQQWQPAAEEYTKGLLQCDDASVSELRGKLLCNRSQCWLKLEDWQRAREDAQACLQCIPGLAKAFLCRAISSEMLGRHLEALSDFKKVVDVDPQLRAAVDGVARLQQKLPQQVGSDKFQLRGWTRICHSDFGTSTAGSTLNWDLPMEAVRTLAKQAMRVRIQTKGWPAAAVISKPNAYPIENIRLGQPIGFGRGLDEDEVKCYWESEDPQMLKCLWHTFQHWDEHGHRSEVCKLETNVYWAACNGSGLHWHGLVDGGYLQPLSTWTNSRDSDLELYIDAVLESGEPSNESYEVLVRNLAGEEVAKLQIPAGDNVCQVKERIGQTCGSPIQRLRLTHADSGVLEDRNVLRDIGMMSPKAQAAAVNAGDNTDVDVVAASSSTQHIEFQMVRLPLDPEAGSQLLEPVLHGDVRIVRRILNDLGDPNFVSPDEGMTPLCAACHAGHLRVVRVLIDAGAELEKTSPQTGNTPLCYAAAMGRIEVVSFLCEIGAVTDQQVRDGMTAMHIAAQAGQAGVIELLGKSGADPNKARDDGRTPLLLAVHNEHAKAVRALIAVGADKEKADSNGCTPLLLAANHGFSSIAKALVEAGTAKDSVWADGSSPLLVALIQGHEDLARFLYKAGADKDRARHDGVSPLVMAAKHGFVDLVRMFIEAGSDKEQMFEDGSTILHVAVQSGQLRVVHYLGKVGMDLNRQDNSGYTPLMLALEGGQFEAARILREAGARCPKPEELAELAEVEEA
mmetsp:Transcript_65450/g.124840  ORF Transcript_65450/g.124840 Transcript_65450/m.124840 type:complete len:755 (-) Transcript_65450:76-2340(-)